MNYEIEGLVSEIKAAREIGGFSQQKLCELSGIPQPQISKFEKGKLNPTLSGFVNLAHALGLELVLAPRNSVPAVKAVIRNLDDRLKVNSNVLSALAKTTKLLVSLRSKFPQDKTMNLIGQYATEVQRCLHVLHSSEELNAVNKHLRRALESENPDEIQSAERKLHALRDELVLARKKDSFERRQRPAFSLENDWQEDD